MRNLRKALYAGIGAGSILINIAVSGAVIALAQQLRYWAYPAFFGFGMFLTGLVLIVLVLALRPRGLFGGRTRREI